MSAKINQRIEKINERFLDRHAGIPLDNKEEDIIYLLQVIEMQNTQIEMYTKHLSAIRNLLALELMQEIKKEKMNAEID